MKKSSIRVKLENIHDGYLPYSSDSNTELTEEFANHILNLTNDNPNKGALDIIVELENPATQNEKAHFTRSLKKYFSNSISETSKKQRHYLLIAGIMLTVGIMLSASMLFALSFMGESIWTSLLEVFLEVSAWVFLWEAVDIACFKIPTIRFESRHNKRLLKSNIYFHEDLIYTNNASNEDASLNTDSEKL